MRWILKHKKRIIFLGIVILLVSIMTVSYVSKDDIKGDNTLGNIIITVQNGIISGIDTVKENVLGIFRYKRVLANNEALMDEIILLNKENNSLKLTKDDYEELLRLSELLNYDYAKDVKDYVAGDVIAQDSINWFHIFTVNVGESDGIIKNATVLNSKGLIGRVIEVGDHWSKVIAITDDQNSVSFQVSRNKTILGVAAGNGEDELLGYTLDPEADIIIGDELSSSNLGLYIEGVPIGVVESIIEDENTLLKTIKIKPYSYFLHLDKVLIVNADTEKSE